MDDATGIGSPHCDLTHELAAGRRWAHVSETCQDATRLLNLFRADEKVRVPAWPQRRVVVDRVCERRSFDQDWNDTLVRQ